MHDRTKMELNKIEYSYDRDKESLLNNRKFRQPPQRASIQGQHEGKRNTQCVVLKAIQRIHGK